jgi:hypothetical protein
MLRTLLALLALGACGSCSKDEYIGRDGKAEAVADFQAGEPIKIYSHVSNGIAPGYATPGLQNRTPDYAKTDISPYPFVMIDAAAFAEGETRTPAQSRASASAIRFAADYNLTTLGLRAQDVRKVCPQAFPERNAT